jgi:transposase InsO family protein
VYTKPKQKNIDHLEVSLKAMIQTIFDENEKVYGSRKIKKELKKLGYRVSRRKISRLMSELGLVSVYTIAQYKVHKDTCNEDPVPNVLNRDFTSQAPVKRIVSDLTYVRVGNDWNYICLLTDLYNREIIGYSCGRHKDAQLVVSAFAKVKGPLSQIEVFHTDRGLEFKNQKIDKILETFKIKRSLSMKGCPYDNAVAEAMYKLIKKEFVYPRRFMTLGQLQVELDHYVFWFNMKRIHSTLDYMSPVEYKNKSLINFV